MTLLWAGLLLACAQDDEAKKADAAIEQFNKSMRTAEVEKRCDAIAELGKTEHLKTLKVLAAFLGKDESAVRRRAAETLGRWSTHKAEAGKALLAGLKVSAKDKPLTAKILEALGELKDKSALPEIHARLNDLDADVSVAAIGATPRIRARESVDVLIKVLEKVEHEDQYLKGARNTATNDDIQRRRDRVARQKSAIFSALQSLTKQSFTGIVDWYNWWNQNKATFRVDE